MFSVANKKGHSNNLFIDFTSLQCFEDSNMHENWFGSYKTDVKETQQMWLE